MSGAYDNWIGFESMVRLMDSSQRIPRIVLEIDRLLEESGLRSEPYSEGENPSRGIIGIPYVVQMNNYRHVASGWDILIVKRALQYLLDLLSEYEDGAPTEGPRMPEPQMNISMYRKKEVITEKSIPVEIFLTQHETSIIEIPVDFAPGQQATSADRMLTATVGHVSPEGTRTIRIRNSEYTVMTFTLTLLDNGTTILEREVSELDFTPQVPAEMKQKRYSWGSISGGILFWSLDRSRSLNDLACIITILKGKRTPAMMRDILKDAKWFVLGDDIGQHYNNLYEKLRKAIPRKTPIPNQEEALTFLKKQLSSLQ